MVKLQHNPQLGQVVSLVQHVTESETGAFLILDASQAVAYASAPALSMLGYGPDFLLTKALGDLLHPDDREVAAAPSSVIGYSGSVRILHESGVWSSFDVSLKPIASLGVDASVLNIESSEKKGNVVETLRSELVVEQFCHSLGTDFLGATTTAQVFDRIQQACAEIAALVDCHSVTLAIERRERDEIQRIGHWVHPDFSGTTWPATMPRSLLPLWFDSVLTDPFVINDTKRAPYEDLRTVVEDVALRAFLSFPFRAGNQRGTLVFGRRNDPHTWRVFDSQLAKAASPIFAAALHRSQVEQLWNLTYDHGSIGFAIRTTDGQLVDCNQQYLDLYGLQPNDTQDTNVFALLHPDDIDGLRAALARLDEDGRSRITYDLRVLHTGGSVRHLHATISEVVVPGQPDPLRLTAVHEITVPHAPTEH